MAKKTHRLQVRVPEEYHLFLQEYAERNGVTTSQIIRDFIDWLKRRERANGTSSSAE